MLLLGALTVSVALSALAVLPTYKNLGPAYGNTTTPPTVIFPADPNSQIRIVSLSYAVTNGNTLSFQSGTTAYSYVYTNPTTTWVTNWINSTNGLQLNSLLVLQHSGSDYTNSVSSWGNTGTATNTFGLVNAVSSYGTYGTGPAGALATNLSYVVLLTGGFGVIAGLNDDLYQMGTASTFPVTGTNYLNGDSIYSGSYGRPVLAQLTTLGNTAGASNALNTVTAHYDSQSQ